MTGQAQQARVRIEGTVQGVFFRAHTKQQADRLGLAGWVRNLPDGAVEAFFAGPADRVENMLAWCHRGSPQARVSRVALLPVSPAEPAGPGFTIRYD